MCIKRGNICLFPIRLKQKEKVDYKSIYYSMLMEELKIAVLPIHRTELNSPFLWPCLYNMKSPALNICNVGDFG